MKKFIKNLFLSVGIVLIMSCCGNTSNVSKKKDITFGTSMKVSYEMMATRMQVDSICVADTLPQMDSWLASSFKDYETGAVQVKRMYIKKNDKNEIIYIILGNEQPYKVTRRITE